MTDRLEVTNRGDEAEAAQAETEAQAVKVLLPPGDSGGQLARPFVVMFSGGGGGWPRD